jgi:ketosteroid isomerase-like protein
MRIRWTLTATLFATMLAAPLLVAQQTAGSNDEATIRKLDEDWDGAAQNKDLDKTVSFYAEDASMFPFNAPLASGKEQIGQVWTKLMAMPGYWISFTPSQIHVAEARDMAYEIGAFELKANDAQGKLTSTPGKFVVVWKKQPSGEWKAVADIFNTDK